MTSLLTKIVRLRFTKNDPLRYQHVLESDRLNYDEPTPPDEVEINLDWYREHPDGLEVEADESELPGRHEAEIQNPDFEDGAENPWKAETE